MRILIFAAILLLMGGISAIYWLINFRLKIKRYGKRLRNYYIFSDHPDDRSLVTRAKEHERWLERSANKSGVEVIIIPFQDKLHPLETWDEYLLRRKEEKRLDMIERDTEIEKKKGRNYYLSEIHEQDQKLETDLVDLLQNLKNGYNNAAALSHRYAAYLREARRRIRTKMQHYRSH